MEAHLLRLILILATVGILALGVPARAFECGEYGPLATGVWQFTDGTAETTYYLDDRDWALGNGFWLFQETNGVWTAKGAGVTHADSVVDHPDLQPSYCSLDLGPDCEGPWCPNPYEFLHDKLLL